MERKTSNMAISSENYKQRTFRRCQCGMLQANTCNTHMKRLVKCNGLTTSFDNIKNKIVHICYLSFSLRYLNP